MLKKLVVNFIFAYLVVLVKQSYASTSSAAEFDYLVHFYCYSR